MKAGYALLFFCAAEVYGDAKGYGFGKELKSDDETLLRQWNEGRGREAEENIRRQSESITDFDYEEALDNYNRYARMGRERGGHRHEGRGSRSDGPRSRRHDDYDDRDDGREVMDDEQEDDEGEGEEERDDDYEESDERSGRSHWQEKEDEEDDNYESQAEVRSSGSASEEARADLSKEKELEAELFKQEQETADLQRQLNDLHMQRKAHERKHSHSRDAKASFVQDDEEVDDREDQEDVRERDYAEEGEGNEEDEDRERRDYEEDDTQGRGYEEDDYEEGKHSSKGRGYEEDDYEEGKHSSKGRVYEEDDVEEEKHDSKGRTHSKHKSKQTKKGSSHKAKQHHKGRHGFIELGSEVNGWGFREEEDEEEDEKEEDDGEDTDATFEEEPQGPSMEMRSQSSEASMPKAQRKSQPALGPGSFAQVDSGVRGRRSSTLPEVALATPEEYTNPPTDDEPGPKTSKVSVEGRTTFNAAEENQMTMVQHLEELQKRAHEVQSGDTAKLVELMQRKNEKVKTLRKLQSEISKRALEISQITDEASSLAQKSIFYYIRSTEFFNTHDSEAADEFFSHWHDKVMHKHDLKASLTTLRSRRDTERKTLLEMDQEMAREFKVSVRKAEEVVGSAEKAQGRLHMLRNVAEISPRSSPAV